MSEFTPDQQYVIDVSRASCIGCSDPYNNDEVIQTDEDVLRYVESYCAIHNVPLPHPPAQVQQAEPPAAPAAAQEALTTPPATEEPPADEPPAELTPYQQWQADCKVRKDGIEEANEAWKGAVAQRKELIKSWDQIVSDLREQLDTAKAVPVPERPATAKKKQSSKKK